MATKSVIKCHIQGVGPINLRIKSLNLVASRKLWVH